MLIIISNHALRRLRSSRQDGISIADLHLAASQIPGRVLVATRFRNYRGRSGRSFDFVIKDIANGRLIITVIGK